MKKFFYICIVLLCILITAACKKDVGCEDAKIYVVYQGFDSVELLYARAVPYKKNTDFKQATDTVRYPPPNGFSRSYISTDYDWLIRIAGKQYKLRNILFSNGSQSVGANASPSSACFNAITFFLNDSLHYYPQWVNGQDTASIRVIIYK